MEGGNRVGEDDDNNPEPRRKTRSRGPGVEHATDGIVRLDLDEINGELRRSLIVWKMRGTAHSMKRHPFEITGRGIIVKKRL